MASMRTTGVSILAAVNGEASGIPDRRPKSHHGIAGSIIRTRSRHGDGELKTFRAERAAPVLWAVEDFGRSGEKGEVSGA